MVPGCWTWLFYRAVVTKDPDTGQQQPPGSIATGTVIPDVSGKIGLQLQPTEMCSPHSSQGLSPLQVLQLDHNLLGQLDLPTLEQFDNLKKLEVFITLNVFGLAVMCLSQIVKYSILN